MVGRVPSRGSDQFVVRMPNGMRDRIAEAASENGRSMNAEIVDRLQASFLTTESIRAEALEEFRLLMRQTMLDEAKRWSETAWGLQFEIQTELDALDSWIAKQPDPKPTRNEALKAIVRRGIKT